MDIETMWICSAWFFVVIAPYWEERSFEDDDNTVYRGIT